MIDIMKLIPEPDAVPLPSPSGLFIFFYVFTFILHLFFVNMTLGGSILLFISRFLGRQWLKPEYEEIAEEIGWANTFNISFTITTGVAPLLFIQVIYGQFFYSSSILLGWKWLSVLIAICLAYYGYYLYKFKPGYIKNSSSRGFNYVSLSVVLFIYVALLFVGNTLLSNQPEIWTSVYSGEKSFMSADTFVPRLLHFVIGSIAIAGVALMVYSRLRTYDENLKKEMMIFGRNAFIIATIIQIPVGFLFLFSHDKNLYMLFLGEDYISTAVLWVGVATAFYTLYLAFRKTENVKIFAGLVTVVMVLMVITRRSVESGYFSKYFDTSTLQVGAQWDVFGIFAILLISLVITIYVMLNKIYKDRKTGKIY